MSNSHEWQFDNAWQEMLNHATLKVMEAEKNKAETIADHQKKAAIFSAADKRVQELEEKYRSSINKSRRYFEEKQVCQDQLETQKGRIEQLQQQIASCKAAYSTALRNLEQISEEIHRQRGDLPPPPPGPREPGVGCDYGIANSTSSTTLQSQPQPQLPDYAAELDKCEMPSLCSSAVPSSAVSEKDPSENDDDDVDIVIDQDLDLEELRLKVKTLAVRPVEGGEGQQTDTWEDELNSTVNKLDHLMMLREIAKTNGNSLPNSPKHPSSSSAIAMNNQLRSPPNSPKPIKQLQKLDPLPLANVSMFVLPTSSPMASAVEIMKAADVNNAASHLIQPQPPKRKLSLQ